MTTDQLKTIPLFADLSEAAVAILAGVAEEASFKDEEVIFDEGDEGDAVYFIAEGAVRIEKRVGDAESKRKTLAIMSSTSLEPLPTVMHAASTS